MWDAVGAHLVGIDLLGLRGLYCADMENLTHVVPTGRTCPSGTSRPALIPQRLDHLLGRSGRDFELLRDRADRRQPVTRLQLASGTPIWRSDATRRASSSPPQAYQR